MSSATLLTAADRALAELERLHGKNRCLIPDRCPTQAVIEELREALQIERLMMLVEQPPVVACAH